MTERTPLEMAWAIDRLDPAAGFPNVKECLPELYELWHMLEAQHEKEIAAAHEDGVQAGYDSGFSAGYAQHFLDEQEKAK